MFTYVESVDSPDFLSPLIFTMGSNGKATALDVGGIPGVNLLHRIS